MRMRRKFNAIISCIIVACIAANVVATRLFFLMLSLHFCYQIAFKY